MSSVDLSRSSWAIKPPVEALPADIAAVVKLAADGKLPNLTGAGLMLNVDTNVYTLQWAALYLVNIDADHAMLRLTAVAEAYRKTTLPQPKPARTYTIPAGAQLKNCSSCGADIFWVLTDNNKRLPVTPDGVSHFATCPHAKQHSRGAAKGRKEPSKTTP